MINSFVNPTQIHILLIWGGVNDQQFCQSSPDLHFVNPGGGDQQSNWRGSTVKIFPIVNPRHISCEKVIVDPGGWRPSENYAAPLSPCEAQGYN